MDVLAVERVREPAGDEDPAAGDAQNDVGLVPVVGDGLGQLPYGETELLVREVLPYVVHVPHTWVRWKFRNEREAVGPR
ncbi:hypothetical protein GCM10011583_63870 [Streptomyces camponoticapitis]|uniref:Transposase n=1 Tax=Streptomyces camponoticapitis TaxID=1616125 RepID=A0ABQ2ESQ0_9ACTN|nr:hypothetical protein GCM10011583_63870 [Streptomyces camponoticapitis]